MRLLVSVRCGAEVAAAVEGGAHIVDAKEPARGSMGAVDAETLAEIAGELPAGVPLSVALGDVADVEQVAAALAPTSSNGALRPRYLKLGFAGAVQPETARRTLAAAVMAASALEGRPHVVAVAYADHLAAACPPPAAVARIAAEVGAAGVLLDTWTKDGRDLFAWCSAPALKEWVGGVRGSGLLAAVAGSLQRDSIATVAETKPHIVGIRGAACDGGRGGQVAAARVRSLLAAISAIRSSPLKGSLPGSAS